MASLLTIPLELLVTVSEYLSTSDLGSLRLTCKQAEKSLYEWFTREFFTKKQFMLTPASLQTLVDISKHASFSKKLTHLIIATNVYTDMPLRFRDKDAAARYIQGFENQKVLLSTGLDREMLTEAFQGLANLDTIGIRDFNASNRVRDGKSWTSWGATTVHRETGIQLQFSSRGTYEGELGGRFVSRVFTSLMYALGKAHRQPHSIEVLLRQYGLPDISFSLPDFLRPTVEPALVNLTSLLLNVDLTNRYVHTHDNGTPSDPTAGSALRRFLNYTPNLTHLRLNFEKHMINSNNDFLEWLGGDVSDVHNADFFNPPRVALPHLKRLEFGQLTISALPLLRAIEKFAPNLEDVCFWRINLSMSMLATHHPVKPWKDVFAVLSRIPRLSLTHFKVGLLQQEHMYVSFKNGDANVDGLKEKEYSGNDMDKFWEELQEQVTVAEPTPRRTYTDSDSEADQDMEDDDDEDEDMDNDDDESEDE
jgi:hypothetical protein